jgi:predicted naringenin-chalcone synthase
MVITAVGSAVPPALAQDEMWSAFFARHYAGDRRARRIFAGAGVDTRHAVVDPRAEDVSTWGTGARMRRFIAEAVPLGKEAVAAALDAAGLDARDVGLFVVASCTGYATPGVDIQLARDLGMSPRVQRLHIGHMGCYAAIPALGAAADHVIARGVPAVVLCVELPSLHVQARRPDDTDQIVSHALFGDAAAAAVLEPGRPGLEVVEVVAVTDPSAADLMTWEVTDLGFVMGLSARVPDVLAVHLPDAIGGLLERHGLAPADVAGWAVHPGGPRILDVTAAGLGLPASALTDSRAVLRDYGNCSSPTVLLVLERLLPSLREGDHVVAMAFGPGLTLYATLLRVRPPAGPGG